MAISATFTCFIGDGFGWLLSWLAAGLGSGMWMGYIWAAVRDGELYFAAGGSTVAVTAILQYILAALYKPKEPFPYGSYDSGVVAICRADYRHFLPDLSVALLYHYWIMTSSQSACLKIKVSIYSRLKHAIYLIGVPIVVVWSRNASPLNAFYGALLGLACGSVMSALLLLTIAPRLYAVEPLTRFLNMHHDERLLDALYNSAYTLETRRSTPTLF